MSVAETAHKVCSCHNYFEYGGTFVHPGWLVYQRVKKNCARDTCVHPMQVLALAEQCCFEAALADKWHTCCKNIGQPP